MEKLRHQMEEFGKEFNSGAFKIDQKQMDDLKRQMEEFRKSLPDRFDKQLQQFRRDMDQLRLGLTQHV